MSVTIAALSVTVRFVTVTVSPAGVEPSSNVHSFKILSAGAFACSAMSVLPI